jgi:hypothetical protein
MPAKSAVRESSQAVQAHLEISQSVIQRMASNSSSCKAWCITLVSAILVVVAEQGKPQYTIIASIPTIFFLILDTYYLGLEKRLRNSYNSFIDKLHHSSISASDLYVVSPKGNAFKTFVSALFSFSVWPFYLMLFLMIWLAKKLII